MTQRPQNLTIRTVAVLCAALSLLIPFELTAQDELSCFADADESEMALLAISCGAYFRASFNGRVVGRDAEGRRTRPRGLEAYSFTGANLDEPKPIGLNTIHGRFSIVVPWIEFHEVPACLAGQPTRVMRYEPVRYRFSAKNCDSLDVWFSGETEERLIVLECDR